MSTTGKAKDNVRLRAEPKFEAPEIGFIRVTNDLEIIGVEGDWLRVKWEDKEGYVARKFILVPDQEALKVMAANPTPPSQLAADKAQREVRAKIQADGVKKKKKPVVVDPDAE